MNMFDNIVCCVDEGPLVQAIHRPWNLQRKVTCPLTLYIVVADLLEFEGYASEVLIGQLIYVEQLRQLHLDGVQRINHEQKSVPYHMHRR